MYNVCIDDSILQEERMMNSVKILTGLALGLFMAASTVQADTSGNSSTETQAKKANTESNSSSKTAKTGGFSYRPPMRGAPAARIGGGTRGIGDKTLELVVLAPDHTGLTTKEQPTLYWYASEPVQAQLEVTLINDESIDPQLEQALTTQAKAGIHSFDLSSTTARLKPGMEYRWFVSAIADKAQRSNDIVASGTIQRIEPDKDLSNRIAAADKGSVANIYAEAGIWSDTIDAISRLINDSPDNSTLMEQRAALLEQVGLQAAADYSRVQNR